MRQDGLLTKGQALLHPEPVLLVDDHEPQLREAYVLADQAVRADEAVDDAGEGELADHTLVAPRQAVGEQAAPEAGAFEPG